MKAFNNIHAGRSSLRAALLLGGLLVTPLLATPAAAQMQYLNADTDFSVTGQSLWDPGNAAGISYSYALTQSWNKSVNDSDYVLGYGGEVDTSTSGTAGLGFYAGVTAGSVNVDFHGASALGLPTSVRAGQTFTVLSGWVGENGTLSTQSPQFTVQVNGLINGSADATVKAEAGYVSYFSKTINGAWNEDLNLLTLNNSSLSHSIDVRGMGILTGSGHVPTIDTLGASTWETTITSTGSDNFLTLDGDITNLMLTLAGYPNAFKQDLSKSLGAGEIDYGYNFLDLYGELNLIARQNFSFTATPMVTLTFYYKKANGVALVPQLVTFPLDQQYQITVPAGVTGSVTVMASVSIANSNHLTNNTQLIVNPGLYFLPMEAHIGGKLVGASLPTEDFTPVPLIDLVSAAFPIPVYNNSFTVGGFQSQTLGTATIKITP